MTTVACILKDKGSEIYSVSPENTIIEALQLMAEKNIGAVLVMKNDHLQGIFTERDYARRGTLQGNPVSTPIRDVMTRQVYYISPDQSAETCMAQMLDKHFRHLPVVKESKVIGVVSIYDVVNTVVEDQKALIAGLENFVIGMEHKQ